MFKKFFKFVVMLFVAVLVSVAPKAQAAIDTTAMDAVKVDALAWLTYGVAAAIAIMLGGLAYRGARWAYKKMTGGLSAS